MSGSVLLPALGGAAGDAGAAVTVAGESASWSQLHDRAHVLGARIVGLGARTVILHPISDQERQLRELADEVLPAVRAALGEAPVAH